MSSPTPTTNCSLQELLTESFEALGENPTNTDPIRPVFNKQLKTLQQGYRADPTIDWPDSARRAVSAQRAERRLHEPLSTHHGRPRIRSREDLTVLGPRVAELLATASNWASPGSHSSNRATSTSYPQVRANCAIRGSASTPTIWPDAARNGREDSLVPIPTSSICRPGRPASTLWASAGG